MDIMNDVLMLAIVFVVAIVFAAIVQSILDASNYNGDRGTDYF